MKLAPQGIVGGEEIRSMPVLRRSSRRLAWLSVNIVLTDLGESHLLEIGNAVLHHRPSDPEARADATLKLTHEMFLAMLTGRAGLKDLLLSEEIELQGSKLDLLKFFSLLDKPAGRFNIIEP